MDTLEKVKIKGVKKIIIIASGKGGVGKSTVSANLSIALARNGYKVALVDADIYGPSIPKLFGLEDAKPEVKYLDNKEEFYPVEKYGVKIMSIGFFVDKSKGLIWRGPMAANAITQLFESTKWEDIDYMIVDFPPGTGDIQLTTVQKYEIDGVIIVTTPQEVATNDARKALSMFNNNDLNVPVLGIVENMSWFSPSLHPEEKYYIFGKNGGKKLADEFKTKLISQIPLEEEVCEGAEKGQSIYHKNNKSVIEAFDNIVNILNPDN